MTIKKANIKYLKNVTQKIRKASKILQLRWSSCISDIDAKTVVLWLKVQN